MGKQFDLWYDILNKNEETIIVGDMNVDLYALYTNESEKTL